MRIHIQLKKKALAGVLMSLTALALVIASAQFAGAGQPERSAIALNLTPRAGSGGPAVNRLHKGAGNPHETGQGSSLSFLPVVTYGPGDFEASMVAVADVNGDGKPDLVVANCGNCYVVLSNGSVGVLIGNGDGTFQPAVTYGSGGVTPLFVAVADVNGDGKLDLVVANRCGNNGCLNESLVSVLLGNGDGTFQTAVTYGSGGLFTSSVAAADVNGDGKPDLLVANDCADPNCDGSAAVLLGNGDGTFQVSVTYLTGGNGASSIAVADVNGDSKPDLLVTTDDMKCMNGTCYPVAAVAVFLGNGDGTFQPPVAYDSGGIVGASVVAADVNHDNKLDLVVENNQCCGVVIGIVGVLLGKGDGTFLPVVTYQSGMGGNGTSAQVADVDGDGNPDLIVTDQDAGGNGNNQGLVGVLLGNGNGTFQAAVTYNTGGFLTNSVAVADVNGDGRPDLLVANQCADNAGACRQSSVGVLLNNTTVGKFITSTTLTSSLNPSLYGQPVTWTATVTSSGSVVPTGTVKFMWSGYSIGSATLNASGIATLTKSTLNADPYPLVAMYVGDTANLGSTSPVLNQVILQTTSSATIVSSLNPSKQGQAVTFTATITSPTVTPTGPVTFTAGKTVLGTGQLSGGKAKFTTSTLAVGSTVITATYYGSSNIAKSSASLTQVVQRK
jgi:hypothetical protein